jgi:glutaredoxin 3
MAKFTVYKRDDCPYCVQAMRFLATLRDDRDDVEVKLVDAYKDAAEVRAAQKRVGRTTVPQIFVDDHHIGGWDDLAAFAQAGRLDAYLATGEFALPQGRSWWSRLFGT